MSQRRRMAQYVGFALMIYRWIEGESTQKQIHSRSTHFIQINQRAEHAYFRIIHIQVRSALIVSIIIVISSQGLISELKPASHSRPYQKTVIMTGISSSQCSCCLIIYYDKSKFSNSVQKRTKRRMHLNRRYFIDGVCVDGVMGCSTVCVR